MTSKIFDLTAAALDFAGAAKDGPADQACVNLQLAALTFAEKFKADCEADASPPAQGDDFTDDLARETN